MSNHYYDQQGKPVYEVPNKSKGGMRSTTIRDARSLNLKPSVTTVTGILDKAGLLRYFLQQIVKSTLSQESQKPEETFEDYVDRLSEVSRRESEKAAKRGNELHNALEKYFKTNVLDDFDTEDFVKPVIAEILNISVPGQFWETEKSFAHSTGFGGRVDLYCNDGKNGIVLDFKTKNTADKKKFYKYNEHLMQLAAYRQGLGLPHARCFDLYFSSIAPGVVELHEWTEDELQVGWKQFQHLLGYWQSANKIDTSFILETINE